MKMTTTGSYDADGRCGLLLRSSSTHTGLVAGLSRLVVQAGPAGERHGPLHFHA
jgi:hypothetical protein